MTDESAVLAAVSGAAPRRRRRWTLLALAVVLALAAGGAWLILQDRPLKVVEHKMLAPNDIPTALAVASDGTVWFSIDFSDAVGIVRNGKIERIAKHGRNVDALGLGVDAAGNVWYADAPAIAILRISPQGEVQSYPLGTPIARLGRLALSPDGAVWFAEGTAYSVTRLKDGQLTRHVTRSFRGGPYGVAVAKDGTVWASLQGADQIMRIAPSGELSEFDLPTRSASPTDVAVDASGVVWFLEFRANKIGKLENGKITEFDAPLEGAGLSGLAAAPDGSVWFGMLRAHALGRLRDGKVKVFKLPRADARPFSVAADANGNIWYTDIGGYVGMIPASEVK